MVISCFWTWYKISIFGFCMQSWVLFKLNLNLHSRKDHPLSFWIIFHILSIMLIQFSLIKTNLHSLYMLYYIYRNNLSRTINSRVFVICVKLIKVLERRYMFLFPHLELQKHLASYLIFFFMSIIFRRMHAQ